MIYLLYDLLLFLASLLYLPFYALRGRVHSAILTRLGFFPEGFFDAVKGQEVVWIHAVSVGEARAADSLLELIRARWPKKRIVISTVTPTGHAILKRMTREDEIVFYAPLDISWVVSKILRLVSPRLLIILETELWPNLIRLSNRQGVRVVVVNGRISDQSFKGYQRLRFFLRPILQRVHCFCMQTEESGRRIRALGADSERVLVTGNIKFDISSRLKESPALARLRQALTGCLLWIAGSTHDNEEEMVTSIYRALHKDFPSLRLLIAPRHLERLDKIKRMIRFAGLEAVYTPRPENYALQGADEFWPLGHPAFRAQGTPGFSPGGLHLSGVSKILSSQVVLLDTMGDLTALYGLCDVAFVGGSLVPTGGHNPLEPALFGKPILFGRYMDNFKEIRDIFIREQAALEVKDTAELEFELRKLLASPSQRQALGERAKALLDKNRGAALRTFEAIEEKLKIKIETVSDPKRKLFLYVMFSLRPFYTQHKITVGYALLFPVLLVLSWLYAFCLGWIRLFYRWNVLKSCRPKAKVISVGNITLGGSGKTPLVLAIATYLKNKGHRVAVLLRGYKRPREKDGMGSLSYEASGDEGSMLAGNLGKEVPVVVGSNRAELARQIEKDKSADTLILDDGFQHWRIGRDLDIVTVDAVRPFGNGLMLPAGHLREAVGSLKRAHVICLTRCDEVFPPVCSDIERKIKRLNPSASVVRVSYRPEYFYDLKTQARQELDHIKNKKVAALCAIAQPQSFMETLRRLGARVSLEMVYQDHHHFTSGELQHLLERCEAANVAALVTTEKDSLRIETFVRRQNLKLAVLVLKIFLKIDSGEEAFYARLDSLYRS